MNVTLYVNRVKYSIRIPGIFVKFLDFFKIFGVLSFIILFMIFLSSYFFSFINEYQLIRYQNKEVRIKIYQQKNINLQEHLAGMVNKVVENNLLANIPINYSSLEDFGYGGGAYKENEQSKKNIDILFGINKNILQNIYYSKLKIVKKQKKIFKLINSEPSIAPADGYITSPFGWRIHPIFHTYDFHKGLDIAAPIGTTIKSPADGVVEKSYVSKSYGNMIAIRHDKHFTSVYAHLSAKNVAIGDSVKKGEKIGEMGTTGRSTGPHLHYEIRYDGKPIDPQNYIYPKNIIFD